MINVHIHKMMIAVIGATFFILFALLLIFKLVFTNSPSPEVIPNDTGIYGEFIPWPEVNKIFPKGSRAGVIDLDTGITFQIQRRGGTSHADVQPLTADDTAAMKKAYNGQWSWKRRGVIIQLTDGTKIAASMAGMPHGQGAIPDNDFDGHFCIHFRDSKTHGSNKVDLAHQMMVWKAAHVLDQQIMKLNQEEIINLFFTAINQQEYNTVGQLIHADIDFQPLLLQLQQISKIKIKNIKALGENKYAISVRIIWNDSNRELGQDLVISIFGNEPPWSIEGSSILDLVEPGTIKTIVAVEDSWNLEEDWDQ